MGFPRPAEILHSSLIFLRFLTSCGGRQKKNAGSTAHQTKLWVKPDIHTTQSEHYDMPLNNQQGFDFVVCRSPQTYVLGGGVLTLAPDYHR